MLIQLGRDICGQLATVEQREWLVTNGIGGYASGTVAGVLTRRYHGLLMAALKPPVDRTLLVTKLEEQVQYDGTDYDLAPNRWADGTLVPQGYCYLERFALEGTVPTWTYALGDALLEKRIWMEQGANTTYTRYTLRRGSLPLRIAVKGLVNYRNHHGATHAEEWIMQIAPIPSPYPGVRVQAFSGAIPFFVFADMGTCTVTHVWYRGYDLAIEQYRGLDSQEDHLHCVTVAAELEVGRSLTIVATTVEPIQVQLEGAITRQQACDRQCLQDWQAGSHLTHKTNPAWIAPLVLAANQFLVTRPISGQPGGKTVIAGYPWFGDWGRDTMIALTGLTTAVGRPAVARSILHTFAQYLDQGMLPNLFPEAGEAPEYNTVDAILWFFEALRVYYAATQDRDFLQELFPALVEVIRCHQQGTRYQIHQDEDGLIYAGEPGIQLTWMDAKVDDWVVTPRIGKPIEVNALWYNALLTMAYFAGVLGQDSAYYLKLANHTRQGLQRFWSDDLGYCYDVLDGPEGADASLRPNQIFAVALPCVDGWQLGYQSPLQEPSLPIFPFAQQKAIVDQVAQELLTSYGLRSLSPHHPDYCGQYGGDRVQRDGQYHQGTAWGWLIGPFVQAHWLVYRDAAIAQSFLEPMADHLRSGCVGNLSEIFDGDPPHHPRGTFAQAWTVAEVLRVWCLIGNVPSENK